MKSGLEGRNNWKTGTRILSGNVVSMKSGLEGRNNPAGSSNGYCSMGRLNEVRPRRPEQWGLWVHQRRTKELVSMKSGLEGRNNKLVVTNPDSVDTVSMKSGLEGRNNLRCHDPPRLPEHGLNEVRPRRPEQWPGSVGTDQEDQLVSMKSGLEGRNNPVNKALSTTRRIKSQ